MKRKTLAAAVAALALAGLAGSSTADAVPGTVSGEWRRATSRSWRSA
ncbi:hypothetical protein [Streptomyces atratus]|nr:hypothetical protein [Streptomyces atratus]